MVRLDKDSSEKKKESSSRIGGKRIISLQALLLLALIGMVGSMIGAITSGFIADVIGRIWAMRVVSVICAAGWLPIYFAQDALTLDIGRFIWGYGMGAFFYLVPVYIAEIAPVNLRGVVATLHQT